ncbi:hypothetical protein [Bradyrhizobium neotropicale]|uniref:hypothetical protein n=1 Tax=Bradyrhizobium neotropicale TaxID=1497615 RepID=UPI001AD7B8E8|nr:hypothetical protein [Bradyrhizobium neotropicale]MBO4228157.1 hypothetical protein [Bradyrhizobium neotropicale]
MSNSFEQQRAEAAAAKAAGMDQVEANTRAEWLELMLELVRLTCLAHARFTMDDPMDRHLAIEGNKPWTHEPRAMGPVMLRAAKLGWCRKANVASVPSRRRSLHASPRAVWESLIHGQY